MLAHRRQTVPATLIALAGAVALLLPGTAAGAGDNLLPNPSFELSVAEGSVALGAGTPQVVSPVHGTSPQPLLPSGWAFEGAALLFDHADNNSDALGTRRNAHSGQRYAAISGPVSGKAEQCVDQAGACVPIPLGPVKHDVVSRAYSVDPVWRNVVPVTVTPGQTYLLRAMASTELMTRGTRATTRVRWLSAGGDVLSVSDGASREVRDTDFCAQDVPAPVEGSFCWTELAAAVTAPAGAAFAVVLLGSSEDVWIGQIMFDDVFFG